MRVVIVDDEPAARRTLRESCDRQADLAVIAEYGDPGEALAALLANPPDLLFLDIQMEPMTGIELARALDPARLPLIVFVTAYDQYAIEAFELSAADYLLKPFDERRFAATTARVRERLAAGSAAERAATLEALLARLGSAGGGAEPPRLLAESGGRLHMLDAARIELVESDRNYVRLRVGRETFHARSTLQQAEQALQSQPMLRISRSCLVNTRHVSEVSRTLRGDFILVLAGGATVTSSEGCRDKVREYLDGLRLDAR
ncbi:MAG: response regulator transcription factor [Gammaproteobacteria bacterium]|nr:response regulator transcription factor [Gammaproteobacteria bacterium]